MNRYKTTRKRTGGAEKGLQRVLLTLLLGLLLVAGTATLVWASDVSDADYYGVVTVSNNDTAAADVSVNCSLNTAALVSGGYLNSSANNCAVQNTSGTDVAFAPSVNASYPWCFWVPNIGSDTYLSYLLYTGNVTGGKIRYFPGDGGMTVSDNDDLEPGDSFVVEMAGWTNTEIIGSPFQNAYAKKQTAFALYNSLSGSITAAIEGVWLDFERTNTDYVTISDEDEFSFTDGDGQDLPFSVSAWVNFEDATGSEIIGKTTTAGNKYEWDFQTEGADKLSFYLYTNDGVGRIGRQTPAVTSNESSWCHYVATYSGNETSGGINIYIDGVDSDNADSEALPYTGMTNGTAPVELGTYNNHASFMDGKMGEVKIFNVELTPAQVLEEYNGGYFDNIVGRWTLAEGTGLPQDSSGNDFDATANTADWVGTYVTASSVSSSNHTVKVETDGIDLKIYIDDMVTPKDTEAWVGTVPDKDNDWFFVTGGSMPYMEYTEITVDDVQQGYWKWEYAETFTDLSGNSHDATPTFRTDSSDPDVSAELTMFLPVAEAQAPAWVLDTTRGALASENITTSGNFTTTPSPTSAPFVAVIEAVSNASATPSQLPFTIIAGFIIVAASLGISYFMSKNNSRSLIIKLTVIVLLFGIFIAVGIFDFWMLVFFLMPAIAIVLLKAQGQEV